MIAVMFPGQGSQSVGMGRDLYERYDTARLTYDEASAVLGYDVAALSFEGPADKLNRTEFTQPALLTHSVAVTRLLEEEGELVFGVALGHSLGEYSALVATGAVGFADAVALVRTRGAAMAAAAAASPGAMAAVLGLDAGVIDGLCAELTDVWPANYNSPGQVVVSGSPAALETLEQRAQAAGAKRVVRLAVSGAFHSPFMAPAAAAMRAPLQATFWAEPAPVYFSVCSVAYEVEDYADLMERQVVSPVRFEQAVRRLYAEGYNAFLEVGPGNVLCGLVKRIESGAVIGNAGDVESLTRVLAGWPQT